MSDLVEKEGMDVEEQQLQEEQLDPEILAEYKAWKKNTPFLYDMVITHSLEWPSLTVEWLNDVVHKDGRDVHKAVLGTHTSGEEPNYLLVADITLPNNETEVESKNYREDISEAGSYGGSIAKIDIKVKMAHDGEVNRARVNPQNSFQIATKSPLSTVFVFDYSKHSSLSTGGPITPKPQYTCYGHTKEGYGLNWSPLVSSLLLSGSDDGKICLWDLSEAKSSDVQAKNIWNANNDSAVIEDVAWHHYSQYLFGSVGDDNKIMIWDIRKDNNSNAIKQVDNAHKQGSDINCISFNKFNENFFATGGSDNIVNIWDMRYLKNPLNSLEGHEDSVYQIEWCPHSETILSSGSSDRRVCIWDISRVGQEQDNIDAATDGPPELIFKHGGHTSKISDISWNPNKPFTIASVSEGNIFQIWTMAESEYYRKKINGNGSSMAVDDADLEDDNISSTTVKLQAESV
jgi:histone-binding protein RBBP4